MRSQKKRRLKIHRNPILSIGILSLVIKLYDTPHNTLMKILYLLVIILILGEFYMSLVKYFLKVKVHDLPEELHKGDTLNLTITLTNKSFLPMPYIYIFFKDSYCLVPKDLSGLCVNVGARSKKTVHVLLEGVRCGSEAVGIESVILMDYLEFTKRRYTFWWEQEVVVLPLETTAEMIEILESHMPSIQEEIARLQAIDSRMQGEVSYDLSPYQQGESERLMHWKLVAQRDIYMVRKREEQIVTRRECLVLLDPVAVVKNIRPFRCKWFFGELRYRRRWKKGQKRADYMDQLISGTGACLGLVLRQNVDIIWTGYYEGKWQQKRVTSESDLEEVMHLVSKDYFRERLDGGQRWPEFELNGQMEKILMTASLDEGMQKKLELDSEFRVFYLPVYKGAKKRKQTHYEGAVINPIKA